MSYLGNLIRFHSLDLVDLLRYDRIGKTRRRVIRAICAGFPQVGKDGLIALCIQQPLSLLFTILEDLCGEQRAYRHVYS